MADQPTLEQFEKECLTFLEANAPRKREQGDKKFVWGEGDDNVGIFERIVDGSDVGPRHDIVVLNAGAALAVAGIVDDLASGIEAARVALRDGSVAAVVDEVRALTNRLIAA